MATKKETVPAPKASAAVAPLWQLATEYRQLLDEIEDAGGELTPEIYDRWQTLPDQLQQKIENTGRMVLVIESVAVAAAAEGRRVAAISSRWLKAAGSLREYLRFHMEQAGVVKIDGTTAKVRVQDNPPSCKVLDEAQVPDEYCEVAASMPADVWTAFVGSLISVHGSQRSADLLDQVKATRKVRLAAVTKVWKDGAGAVDVPGTRCDQTRSVRIS